MSQVGGMGAPTPRRSTRLSQAGSVTSQSVLTTVTAGGTRQRKKGPLTKIKNRKSNAYGASGRVGAAEEITVTATGFAQAFQNQRGDAVARDDEEEEPDDVDELGAETPRMSGALNSHSPHGSPSPELGVSSRAAPGQSFEESDGVTPSEDGLTASLVNTSKSFGVGHEAGMLSRSLRQIPSRDSLGSDGPWSPPIWQKTHLRRHGRAQMQDEAEATPQQHPIGPTPAYKAVVEQSVNELVAEEQERMQRNGMPQPQSQQRRYAHRQQFKVPEVINQWLGNVQLGHENEREWSWKRFVNPIFWSLFIAIIGLASIFFLSPSEFSESVPRVPNMASAVVSRVGYQWGQLAQFIQPPGARTDAQDLADFKAGDDNVLWNRMYKLNKKWNGQFEDVHKVIKELKNELPDLLVIRRHRDGHQEITDEFWHALISKARSKEDDPTWNDYLKANEKKLRALFSGPIDITDAKHWPEAVSRQEFLDTMDQRYQSISTQVDKKIFEAIKSHSSRIQAIAQAEARKAMVDSLRLQSLAQSNLVANYELSLRKPNYFSPGLGARIEPTLTSATFLDNPRFLAKFARRLALIPQRNPPKAALESWEEPGDCWCSAPNPLLNGQAQLAVSLSRPMYPNQVTIEHLPMSMLPAKKITNAPRDVELWVETKQPIRLTDENGKSVCSDGPAGWACLGSFKYNIHAFNHQQTFELDAEVSVPVTKAMLRVTSNWGADHTCLYRVRLHGADAEEDYRYETVLHDHRD